MGWFTRTHPLELPSGRILVPMYSDGYSYGIMAISDDRGYHLDRQRADRRRGLHPALGGAQEGRHAGGVPAR